MIISPDIRLSCGKTTSSAIIYNLGCNNQYIPADANIKQKYNNTKMYDYHSSSCHNYISPPSQTLPESSLTPFCVPAYDCGNCTNDLQWCLDQLTPEYFYTGDGTSSINFPVGAIYNNTYSQSNNTGSSLCRNLGFKNVYASKCWQGIHSYTSNVWGKPEFWDWCCDTCAYLNYDTSSDNVKYRTMTAWATYDVDQGSWTCPTPVDQGTAYCCKDGARCACESGIIGCSDPVEISCRGECPIVHAYWGSAASATSTVDIYGNSISTCASSSYGADAYGNCGGDPTCIADTEVVLSNIAFGYLAEANNNWSTLISIFQSMINGSPCGIGGLGTPTRVTSTGNGNWHLEYDSTITCPCVTNGGCGCSDDETFTQYIIDITPTTLDYKQYAVTIGPPVDGAYCNGDEYCHNVFLYEHTTWAYSATSYDRTTNIANSFYRPDGGYTNTVVHAELGDSYTADQVNTSLVTLLGTWDFGDVNIYPWKNSSNKTQGPWVHYDEIQSAPYIVNHCNTSSMPYYTGRIIGAPGPQGIDKIWDPLHPNYCVCSDACDDSSTGYTFYIDSYGAWSTDCGTPRATCWLNTFQSNNMPDGALCGTDFMWTMPSTCNVNGPVQIHDDILWGCKYAEIIFPKQSFNYARPCGADRITLSQSLSWCATASISSSIIGLQTAMDNFGSEPIAVCGIGGIDNGIYSASWAGSTVTLTHTVASSSWFPTPLSPDCGTGFVARLQWPKITSGICGRIAVLTATRPTSSFPYTCSLSDPAYWFNNDQVVITGSNGGGLNLDGTWTVYPINSASVILSGSQTLSNSIYLGKGQMYNVGAPDYKWNDTTTKGEFSVLKWKMNYIDTGEWTRVTASATWNSGLMQCCYPAPCPDCNCPCPQPYVPPQPRQNQCGLDWNVESMSCDTSCLPFDPCKPSVAYFSPNVGSESFVKSGSMILSAKNYGFSYPGMDSRYGNMWQGIFKQTMNDLYYVAPPCPCGPNRDPDTGEILGYDCSNCSWQMDDGTCEVDNPGDSDLGIPCIKYYPHINQYESRCSPPSGSPALMAGTKMGCYTTISGSCFSQSVCSPPYSPGTFPETDGCGSSVYLVNVYEDPWILLQLEEYCVCYSGQFDQEYVKNGIGCPTEILPAP